MSRRSGRGLVRGAAAPSTPGTAWTRSPGPFWRPFRREPEAARRRSRPLPVSIWTRPSGALAHWPPQALSSGVPEDGGRGRTPDTRPRCRPIGRERLDTEGMNLSGGTSAARPQPAHPERARPEQELPEQELPEHARPDQALPEWASKPLAPFERRLAA